MTLLAFDPGVTTGCALKVLDQYETCIFRSREEVWEMIKGTNITVIYEAFFTSHMISRDGLYTLHVIGGIEALCYRLQIPCVAQRPQQRKAFELEAKKLLKHQHTEHELSALAHMLRWEYDNAHPKD